MTQTQAISPFPAMVDELGILEAALLPFREAIARVELLRKLLRASVNDKPPADSLTIKGNDFLAIVGPKSMQSTVNVQKLQTLIHARAFAELATVTQAAMKAQAINPAIVAQVLETRLTGSRPLDIVVRPANPTRKAK